MTHITQARVIGNHAAMDQQPPTPLDTPLNADRPLSADRPLPSPLTVADILRAGARRRARRNEMAAAPSMWDSEGGQTERATTRGEISSYKVGPALRGFGR
jgi:hypothetical protein